MEASQGHDDIVMSLGLAAHLANIPRRLGLFQVAKMPGLVRPQAQAAQGAGDPGRTHRLHLRGVSQ
jgi:hypothetical protein